ncbi:MAG: ABC transporter substrate-binding protein [Candidatus Tectomicrobia bacterium]|nr:ABC transporter substrate-binding protein [Candidatus Tectomicrobia bacterium]
MTSLAGVRLIQFRAGYNLPVHAGVEKGVFARHGLEVEASYTSNSVYLVEALEAGAFDVGHASADDVIAEVEGRTLGVPGGSDLFLFMGLHSGLLSLVGAPGVRDIESLRGKSLAVDARTTGFVFILEKMLRRRGIGPQEYELVEVGGWESRCRALLEGRHAGTLLTEPFLGDAVEAGCRLLARGHEAVPVYQATCGAATRSWARRNADVLVRYIRAYVEATQWCFDPLYRRACLEILAAQGGMRDAAAERTLDALLDPRHGLYPRAELNVPGVAAALSLRAEMGHLAPPAPPPEKYLDLMYYREAVASA